MHNRLIRCLLFSVLVTFSLRTTVAQQGGRGQTGAAGGNTLGRGAAPLVPDKLPYDKHDLSGVWLGNQYGFNSKYEPPMTPEG